MSIDKNPESIEETKDRIMENWLLTNLIKDILNKGYWSL